MKHVYYFLLILFFTNVLIAQQVQVVPGTYGDLAYVSSRDAIYALRLALDGGSNQLCRIDATTGEVRNCLDLEGDPLLLRPTSSGDYLYVVFRESNRVIRVDLTSEQIDQDFNLGGVGTMTNRLRVADLLPLRNSDDRFVVSSPSQCCGDPAFTGLALVEGGSLVALLPTDSYRPTTLAYTDRDDRIIGFDNTSNTYGLSYINLVDDELVLSPPSNQIFESGTVLKYDGNQRAYTTGGTIINLLEEAPEVLNQFPIFNIFSQQLPSGRG